MSYKSLQDVVVDLEKHNQLIRIKSEVDPDLEMAEIHNRIFEKGGPAILFENVKGSPFRALSNIYGTFDRTDFLFRHTIEKVKKVIELKADPTRLLKNPLKYLGAPFTALTALPMKSFGKGAVQYGQTTIDQLPLVKSWPMDGGAFVTMPQVLTLPPGEKKAMKTNLGMYRIQLSGNEYALNKEIGLHYQLHRGIGNHHTEYLKSDKDFRCSIFVGGLPSHAFSAIMPMPEEISELTFAGMLGGRRFRYKYDDQGHFLSSDADFVITGRIRKGETKPEGPFGDHLGYYSLEHPFPVMDVDRVYHRKDAIWHFSVVGRPPMEDSSFGYLIHELVKELASGEFPGIKEINAVDAAGVHPLLLAIGKERYMPFREKVPEEILTIANRVLGSGQTSLAKFLIICAEEDNPNLDTHDIGAYFDHFLSRVDWTRDLHFQTKTTIDTLDYSGSGWNSGSKVIMACRGAKRVDLKTEKPTNLKFNEFVKGVSVVRPGVLGIATDVFTDYNQAAKEIHELSTYLQECDLNGFPLIVLTEDDAFLGQTLNNFLWVTFTRANPSHDIYGVESSIEHKHWGCKGPLIIDARIKAHHAPVLEKDPKIVKKVDQLFSKG
ncbi:MAG: UbiD family decarboxylase, partial [Saprospiraceae bacterium]|nr:UbiD family decarboxylase [Saprospiraceae bacterium]